MKNRKLPRNSKRGKYIDGNRIYSQTFIMKRERYIGNIHPLDFSKVSHFYFLSLIISQLKKIKNQNLLLCFSRTLIFKVGSME